MEMRFPPGDESLPPSPEGTTPDGELDEQALEASVPDLVRELAAFHPAKTLATVGGLLTMPGLQANTIRLETLVKLIQRHARGKHAPTRNALHRWLNAKLGTSVAAKLEDPVEDVFISNVLCGMGNARLFEGIWEGSDFHLQCALEAVLALKDSPARMSLLAESHALLALSDSVAEEAGLRRNTIGSGKHGSPIKLPSKVDIDLAAERVTLPVSRLKSIPELWPHLECFIHDAAPNRGQGMANSLVLAPLVSIDDNLILSLPSAVSPAIRMRIVDVLGRTNQVALYRHLVLQMQVQRFGREVVPALDLDSCREIEPAALPPDGPGFWQTVLTFDVGKYVHVVFLAEGNLTDNVRGGAITLMPREARDTLDAIQRTRDLLLRRKDYSGGLTLFVRAGLDARLRGSLETGGKAWHVSMMYLHDLLMLAHSNRFPLLRLWKAIEHRADLEANGIQLINMSGDFNLLAWAEQNAGRLVPIGAPLQPDLAIPIPSNAVAGLRRELREDYDEHAVALPSQGCWRRVQRLAAEPLFEHVSRLPAYTVPLAEVLESCEGLVETDERVWWLRSDYASPEPGEARLFQHRLWEGMLLWLCRIALRAEAEWSFKSKIALELRLTFEGWPLAPGMNIGDLPRGDETVKIAVDQASHSANLIVPNEFFHLFMLRENVAERRLIEALLTAAARLAGADLSRERATEISGEIVGGPNARYLHAFEWGSIRLGHPAFRMIRAVRVDQWEKNRAELGIAHRALKQRGAKALETRDECHAFLLAVAVELWTDIKRELSPFDRVSTLQFALENFEGLEVAFERWNVASASQLTLHGSGDDVHGILAREEHRRAEAALSTRVLAEMAVCTCKVGGKAMTSAAFETALAQISLLLTSGALCDAYHYELATPPILIEPSGSWTSLSSFSEEIVGPFHRQTMREHYDSMALHYADLFPSEEGEQDESWLSQKQFIEAVTAELGLPLSRLMAFCKWLLKEFGPSVAQTNLAFFTERATAAGFSGAELNAVWQNLALQPRADWSVAPTGFKASDIHPWRFNRQLSLLTRPFVIADAGPTAPILFAPVAVTHCLELRLTRAYLGESPQSYHRSSEMRAWADAVTHREGIAFELETSNHFKTLGWQSLPNLNMTALGAEKRHGNLDVLAWLPSSNVVALVECKRLLHARTVGEIAKRLIAFRGMQKDLLARHLVRVAWLTENRRALERITSIPAETMRILPLLVTNAVVPMQFVQRLPLAAERIIAMHQLADRLPELLQDLA